MQLPRLGLVGAAAYVGSTLGSIGFANPHWQLDLLNPLSTLAEARTAIAAHVEDYNQVRPHDSLARRTPCEYAQTLERYLNPQKLAA